MLLPGKTCSMGVLLRSRVASIVTARGPQPFFSLATLLLGLSVLYGGIVRLRRKLYRRGLLTRKELPCPVISVGNLAVGGTGKTPMVIHLAVHLEMLGYRCAILSRGYKGAAETKGAVVSDGKTILCEARQAGDEPYLMATQLHGVPVLVGRDRYTAGMEAVKRYRPDVILLDDGYQHLRLKRDLNIVLMDAEHPFGNGHLLPRGTLREPVDALHEADVVVLTRSEKTRPGTFTRLRRMVHPRPLFACRHQSVPRGALKSGSFFADRLEPVDGALGDLRKGSGFAFAGLGRNDAFFQAITCSGMPLAGEMGFEDHHIYSHEDLIHIGRSAETTGAGFLVTSDKDFVRLPRDGRFSRDLIVLGVEMDFGRQKEAWWGYMDEWVTEMTERQARDDA